MAEENIIYLYEKCIYYKNGNCGEYKRRNKQGICTVKELASDVKNHLIQLKVYPYSYFEDYFL